MSCSCAYESEECDEPSTVWREASITRTRKKHICHECGDAIPAGSRCCSVSSLYDGQWYTWYRCVSCSTYAEYISMAAELCPLWGHLWDFVTDNDLGRVVDEDEEGNEIWEGLPTLEEWRERDKEALRVQDGA